MKVFSSDDDEPDADDGDGVVLVIPSSKDDELAFCGW